MAENDDNLTKLKIIQTKSNANQNETNDERERHFLLPDSDSRTPLHIIQYIPNNGLLRYRNTLKNFIPVCGEKSDPQIAPLDKVGFFSHISLWWMTSYIIKAYKNRLSLNDLPLLSQYDTCNYNAQRLGIAWQAELSKHGPDGASFARAVWKFIRTRIFLSFFFLTCSVTLGFISPTLLMRNVLIYAESSDVSIWHGIKWALLLTLCDTLKMIFFNLTWLTNIRTAMRLKGAATTLLYKKLIKLNSLENKDIGSIINMFSNDNQRLYDMVIFVPMIINGPIILMCSIAYILWLFNPISLSGLVVFIMFYFLQYAMTNMIGQLRIKTVKVSDIRVKLMNEVLSCIRLIKMYSWEKYFEQNILAVRKDEEKWLRKTAYLQSLGISLTPAVPVISIITTFLAHTMQGHNLIASQAFPISAVFTNQLKMAIRSVKDSARAIIDGIIALKRIEVFPLVSIFYTQVRNSFMYVQKALLDLTNSRIALERMQKILLLEENHCYISKPLVTFQALTITNATFVCDPIEKDNNYGTKNKHSKKRKNIKNLHNETNETDIESEKLNHKYNENENGKVCLLKDITFEAQKGKLIGICGQVGSGKSSILLAALGELQMTKGKIMRDGSCAYVNQQAWIVNATFRENILFGEQFDSTRYYQALTVCSLVEDINSFPASDFTEIGERGINLSGGQKQRVALARALYANNDIYFLDDPLSAVDAEVAINIFESLILDALRNKTVLFVTHQVHFLKHCDYIYMMHEGKIAEHGTHVDLIHKDGEYAAMVHASNKKHVNSTQNKAEPLEKGASTTKSIKFYENYKNDKKSTYSRTAGAVLIEKEKVEIGTVKTQTYNTYIQAAGGYFIALLVFLTFFLNVGSTAFSTWWLATWIKAGGGNVTVPGTNETIFSDNIIDNPNFDFYKSIYASCVGVILVMSLIRGLALTLSTINASSKLHRKIFEKLMTAPLNFFERTPIGRIQNIFSRDISEVDSSLPIAVENVLQYILLCSFAIIFVCSVIPWFCIPMMILGIIFLFISKLFRSAIRDLNRIESTSRSPVLSFITTTFQGSSTIHAFKKEKLFVKKLEEYVDCNILCRNMSESAARWLSLRLDSVAIASTFITALFVVFLKGQLSPALAGLAMTYCAQIAGVFQFTVRVMSEAESKFINVERINDYIRNLKKEGCNENLIVDLSKDWPKNGRIKFQSVNMKYRKDLPFVLIDVSFECNPREKIGIVGRTGAGKSSLLTALFRLTDITSGIIEIDDVDITKIELNELRSKLSIIPQDPVLFCGTIRSNLDPFKMYTDEELWNVLEKTQLKVTVATMPGQLDAAVLSGGSSLSIGERQLLCLARALLRRSKILVLDEATSSVDPETETIVQNTIKSEFANCSVLTIAHRLQTVIACDRILVMKNGQVAEFDSPTTLLSNPKSEFSQMMAASENCVAD